MLDVYPIRLRFIFGYLLVSAPPLFKRHRFSASGNPCRKRKNSGKELLLFLFLAFLADCCILFTITSKKTKCSTALSDPIFLPLLFCSRGVFFSVPTRMSVVLSRSAFCSAKRAIKPVQGCTGLITAPKNRTTLQSSTDGRGSMQ